MKEPFTCLSCASKFCEKTELGTFDICQYGISFLNKPEKIIKKEPKVPISTIANNLRHEINPILQAIVQQASILDNTLSTKNINPENPLSLIVGSTVIIDNFIQMITGVHEFHSSPINITSKKISLKAIIDSNYHSYGIVKEEGRTKHLKFNNYVTVNYFVRHCSDLIKYILAVLIDNAWKYSIDNSTLTVNINHIRDDLYRLKITNTSSSIPASIDIFELGAKVNKESKGFGYGLNWIKTLETNYNQSLLEGKESEFRISHNQITSHNGLSFQEFILENLKIEKQ